GGPGDWSSEVCASDLNYIGCVVFDLIFDLKFHRIGQLESIAAKKLDAIVAPRIVRSGNNDSRFVSMRAGEKRHVRRGLNACALLNSARLAQSCGGRSCDP